MKTGIVINLRFSDILPYILIFLPKPFTMSSIVNREDFISACRLLQRRVISKGAKENDLFTTFKNLGQIIRSTMFSGLTLCKLFLVATTYDKAVVKP